LEGGADRRADSFRPARGGRRFFWERAFQRLGQRANDALEGGVDFLPREKVLALLGAHALQLQKVAGICPALAVTVELGFGFARFQCIEKPAVETRFLLFQTREQLHRVLFFWCDVVVAARDG
jgi:hypothetical protein